jgi:transcriptional antiterminator NusG
MAEQQYWAACQTMPGQEHVIRAEIEKIERGAFLPTFARTWVTNGKISAGERPLVPGYVFFQTDQEDWGGIQDIEGVQRVLVNESLAMRVSDADMRRLVLGHVTGEHNDYRVQVARDRRARGNSRRPRPSKRARAA